MFRITRRKAVAGADCPLLDFDQLEAAAAEIAGNPIRMLKTGDDAKRCDARFFTARKHLRTNAADRLDVADEIGSVLGLADCSGGDHVKLGNIHLACERRKAADRRACSLRSIGGEFS